MRVGTGIQSAVHPPKITKAQNSLYDESMGRRKEQIINNIKRRIAIGKEVSKFASDGLKFPNLTTRSVNDGFAANTKAK